MNLNSTKKKKHLTFVKIDGWQAFVLFYENKLLPLESEKDSNSIEAGKTHSYTDIS